MGGKYNQEQVVNFLTKHLGRVESIRNHILKEFYEERTEERENFKDVVDQYIKDVRNFMNLGKDNPNQGKWPLILIGSVVEVKDLDYSEIEKLKIVPTFYEDNKEKLECASCLSPVGNALLFKGIGDKITVETPLGDCNFTVESIEVPSI